jgi:zinc and cadmium transporter
LPAAVAYGKENIFLFPLFGILSFFVVEKLILWHHHHTKKEAHAFTYLNLIGDAFHNFIDGLIIAASFLYSVPLGITTTVAIIFHEIPQEIGDFSLLVYGGFSRTKALMFNFISALLAVVGGVLGFFFLSSFETLLPYLLAFTAGHFIYIASTDIIPELMEQGGVKTSLAQFVSIVVGIFMIWFVINVFE